MTVRNLQFLFRPQSVAVVVDTGEASRYAEVVRRNLGAGGFPGPVFEIVARRRSRFGIGGGIRLDKFAAAPDLAIVCAAPDNVAPIIAQLGAAGTRAVIIGPAMVTRWRQPVAEARGPSSTPPVRTCCACSAPAAADSRCRPAASTPAWRPLFPAPARSPSSRSRPRSPQPYSNAPAARGSASRRYSTSDGDRHRPRRRARLAGRRPRYRGDPCPVRHSPRRPQVHVGGACRGAQQAGRRHSRRSRRGRAAGRQPAFDRRHLRSGAAPRRLGQHRHLGDLFEAAEAMARVRPPSGERLGILANGHGLGRIAGDALLRGGGQFATLSRDTRQADCANCCRRRCRSATRSPCRPTSRRPNGRRRWPWFLPTARRTPC